MEKSNLLVNGGMMKLPIGYRFHPTDEEIVVHYLRRKVFGVPLPASVIPEFDVFQTHPWNLPGDLKEKRYFFGKKCGNESEKRCKTAAGSGYWKPIGKDRPIIASYSNHLVGMRKTHRFCEGKYSNESKKTQWIMDEYRLIASGTILNTSQVIKMNIGDWVVYRVFQKKRRPKKQGIIISKSSSTSEVMSSSFMEGPSSPCSSGITEVSSNGLDQEETSSSISFSFHSCKRKST